MKSAKIRFLSCPQCGHTIKSKSNWVEGMQFSCEECRELLEVVETDPLMLDIVEDSRHREDKKRRIHRQKTNRFDFDTEYYE